MRGLSLTQALAESSKTPLIRFCHLLPPQKAREEKALDW